MRRILIAFCLLVVFMTPTSASPAKAENITVCLTETLASVSVQEPLAASSSNNPDGFAGGLMLAPVLTGSAVTIPTGSPLQEPTGSPSPAPTASAMPAEITPALPDIQPTPTPGAEPDVQTITLTFAGDCTIGDDDKYAWNTFDQAYRKAGDPAYFFAGVQDVFAHDDLTFINFEGTLTTASRKAEKEYRFKGDPSYIEVLQQGSIEAVTLANNHSLDYLDKGFSDTVQTLSAASIPYTYFETAIIQDVKGMKIGLLGLKGWEHETRSNRVLEEKVRTMRQQGVSFIVANYHWGDEMSYVPNSLQRRMAHFAIDHGVDLVIGHHPHVMQGMEIYKGRNILYSLGNFCFGGAPNPRDKDTFIYQQILTYDTVHKCILKADCTVIPARVSSEAGRNNYQPVMAEGKEKDRILQKFLDLSAKIR